MPKEYTYTVRKLKDVAGMYLYFEVAKWEDGAPEPEQTYDVELHKGTNVGSCNCPAGRMHRYKGNEDKHVTMVKNWIAEQIANPPERP